MINFFDEQIEKLSRYICDGDQNNVLIIGGKSTNHFFKNMAYTICF